MELRTHLWIASRIPIMQDSQELKAARDDLQHAIGMLVRLLKRQGAHLT